MHEIFERGIRGITIDSQGNFESIHFDPKKTPKETQRKLVEVAINNGHGLSFLGQIENGEVALVLSGAESLGRSGQPTSPIEIDEFVYRTTMDLGESLEIVVYPPKRTR